MIKYSKPFLLSDQGSTRGTAYGFSNKSATLDGKTHVIWLDAVASVNARTYDHATKTWGPTVHIDDGCDNHTSPTFTVDADKHVHIVYGPHGWWGGWNFGRFRWAVSEKPNCIDTWQDAEDFGYNGTYASMAHTPDDTDVIVYRGGETPASVMFQRKRKNGGWTSAKELLGQDIMPQYTHVNATVASTANGTLYVAAHFYNVAEDFNGPQESKKTHGAAIIKSTDMGDTWTSLSDEPVATPSLYDDRMGIPPLPPYQDSRYMDGLVVDSKSRPHVLMNCTTLHTNEMLLHRWDDGKWHSVDVSKFLPEDRVATDTVLTIDTKDRIHIVATCMRVTPNIDRKTDTWGRESNEVFHLMSQDQGQTFECNMVSIADDKIGSWLPNITRGGIHQAVELPTILYTHGVKGDGCSPDDKTDIYCVQIESID